MAVNLGAKVEDNVTGYTGITIGIAEHLHGCRHVIVQARQNADASVPEAQVFDEQRCKVLEQHAVDTPAMPPFSVSLGDYARDRVTGFEGVVSMLSTYLGGGQEVALEPDDLDENNQPHKMRRFEAGRVVLVEAHPPEVSPDAVQGRPGGPSTRQFA